MVVVSHPNSAFMGRMATDMLTRSILLHVFNGRYRAVR